MLILIFLHGKESKYTSARGKKYPTTNKDHILPDEFPLHSKGRPAHGDNDQTRRKNLSPEVTRDLSMY